MKHIDHMGLIPEQKSGEEIEAFASITLHNKSEALFFYHTVKERLLNVNNWHHMAGIISASFQLFDSDGKAKNSYAEKGDFIRIDIPGPGSNDGKGYDWVQIEELLEITTERNRSVGFRVRPCRNPIGDSDHIAHFYSEQSTSSFIVNYDGPVIAAIIVDRNIKPNEIASSLIDKVRHTAIGMGAIGGFSKIQWQNLVQAFIAYTPPL